MTVIPLFPAEVNSCSRFAYQTSELLCLRRGLTVGLNVGLAMEFSTYFKLQKGLELKVITSRVPHGAHLVVADVPP